MLKFFNFSGIWLLSLLSIIIFFPFIGEINLFDIEETKISAISKEMFLSNNFIKPILGHQIYYQNPPLFNWMQIICYKYLGINDYSARLPNAIIGLSTILLLYNIGKTIFSKLYGYIWALLYLSLSFSQLYHKSALLEPSFNFFIFLCVYNISKIIEMRQEKIEGLYKNSDIAKRVLLLSIYFCLAFLTKGIETLFIIIGSYWIVFVISKAKYGIGYKNMFSFIGISILFLSIWGYLTLDVSLSYDYLKKFFNTQYNSFTFNYSHFTKNLGFHFISMLIGCFPASIIAIWGIVNYTYIPTIQRVMRLMMFASMLNIFIYSIFFTNNSILNSSFLYFPITFLATYSIKTIIEREIKYYNLLLLLILIIGLSWVIILFTMPLLNGNLKIFINFVDDKLLQKILVNADLYNNYEFVFGILFFLFLTLSLYFLYNKRVKLGFSILIISTMYLSELILIYYIPKIEFLSQSPVIEFIKIKRKEKCNILYFDNYSYSSIFYSDSVEYDNSNKFSIDNIQKYNSYKYPIYIYKKEFSNIDNSLKSKHFEYIYTQGIYEFYKYKH